jgi:hypothetical protein
MKPSYGKQARFWEPADGAGGEFDLHPATATTEDASLHAARQLAREPIRPGGSVAGPESAIAVHNGERPGVRIPLLPPIQEPQAAEGSERDQGDGGRDEPRRPPRHGETSETKARDQPQRSGKKERFHWRHAAADAGEGPWPALHGQFLIRVLNGRAAIFQFHLQSTIEASDGEAGMKGGDCRGKIAGQAMSPRAIQGERRIVKTALPQVVVFAGGSCKPSAGGRGVVPRRDPLGEAPFRFLKHGGIGLVQAEPNQREQQEATCGQECKGTT